MDTQVLAWSWMAVVILLNLSRTGEIRLLGKPFHLLCIAVTWTLILNVNFMVFVAIMMPAYTFSLVFRRRFYTVAKCKELEQESLGAVAVIQTLIASAQYGIFHLLY